ncbi:sulfite exporter TauE/SafE family protein [Coraliomargarita parva]|uniref:sulfite exporter TauE/SafE family protein n=1 Tax=Coraliomargarita parva TaxID=3014050 RepID=UPI0022B3AE1C|nr:sulfite exporter TauE/SafE family protein [Coraliomargarita parva]
MDAVTGTTTLLSSAVLIGVTHTLMGPDHYLPFVALGKARSWSVRRTLFLTFLCGLGHVAASVLIGCVGAMAGWSLGSLESLESARGEMAAWLLIIFGLFYLVWALRRFVSGDVGHSHVHADGSCHAHTPGRSVPMANLTGWSLFVVFVFGPCEALIPLLLYPSLAHHFSLSVAVIGLFAVATISTMLCVVWMMLRGISFFKAERYGRYSHVVAGAVVLSCGAAIHVGL